MFHREMRFVGISSTAGTRPMQYAILDGGLKLHALGVRDMEGVLALVGGLESAVVAIGAPQGPNRGVLTQARIRRRLNLDPEGGIWTQWRLCEYELKRRNIRLHNTPDRAEDAPMWMQNGFKLFQRLGEMGFKNYERDRTEGSLVMLEVQPHASFTVLLERRPFIKRTLEGRLQRQLVLHLEGLGVANPEKILKGIHREHLLRSQLPLDGLQTPPELDTLVNAYTAYLAITKPERTIQVGDKVEGQITVPSMQLKDFYI
jgi:predicted nuclease with RNAse H fold